MIVYQRWTRCSDIKNSLINTLKYWTCECTAFVEGQQALAPVFIFPVNMYFWVNSYFTNLQMSDHWMSITTSIHLHPRHTTVATIVSCPNVQICRLFPLERWRDSPDAYFRQGGGGLSQSVDTVVVVFVGWSAPLNQGSHFVKDPSLGLSQQNGNCRLNSEKHMFYSG